MGCLKKRKYPINLKNCNKNSRFIIGKLKKRD